MPTWNARANELFLKAREIKSPEVRQRFLDDASAGDSPLRAEVEALLLADDQAGSFLESPVTAAQMTIDLPTASERPGTYIGPYKLLEQIGEGGFGVVFMAEQTRPVRRKVALKILKAGMDTRQVVARFEAERQALAIMDHPNIARVYDGGTTDSPLSPGGRGVGGEGVGRPYFVMELVKGIPITAFCDQNNLTPRQRLELFLPVCQAVQHAHQKGIIHRDLKPNNVLVSRHDTTPFVKVIDFGVAKALGQELTDKTLFTGIAQMIGTPLYMSPEQAGMSDLDVDTRSDIYSLGVLLYELLTGSTPFSKERFKKAAYDEICRIIREEDPPKPSTRLSQSFSTLSTISDQRQTEPTRLTKLMRGELDWIVMKALEKDRNRRYETANSFLADLQRYLGDEPVQACPPSLTYRFRKLVRRNKTLVLATALVLLVLIGGIIGTSLGLVRARHESWEKEQAWLQAKDNLKKARLAVDDSFTRISESTFLHHPTLEPLRKELLQSAARYYEEFVRDNGNDTELQTELVAAYFRIAQLIPALGAQEDWLTPFEKGVALMDQLMQNNPAPATLSCLQSGIFRPMATYWPTPRTAEALVACEKGRAIWERLVRLQPNVAGFQSDLAFFHGFTGFIQDRQGRTVESVHSFRQACMLVQEVTKMNPSTPHYRVLLVMGHAFLQGQLTRLGEHRDADESDRHAMEGARQLVVEFPNIPYYQELLAWTCQLLRDARKYRRQPQAVEEAGRLTVSTFVKLARDYPTVNRYRSGLYFAQRHLGELLWGTGRREQAAEVYREILGGLERVNPLDASEHDDLAWFLANCPDPQFQDPHLAIKLAKHAIELKPNEAEYWHTLGLAHYRAGDWTATIEAINTSVRLSEGDCWDFMVLAMAHRRLGELNRARQYYDMSTALLLKKDFPNPELSRLRTEAEQLLEIKPK